MRNLWPFLVPGALLLMTAAIAFALPHAHPSFATQGRLVPYALGGVLLTMGLGFGVAALVFWRSRRNGRGT